MLVKQGRFDPEKGFTQIANKVLFDGRLSPLDKLMYAALSAFAWHGKDTVWPAMKTLSELVGVHYTTVRTSLRRLEKAGLVSIEQGGGRGYSNHYRLLILSHEDKGSAGATLPEKGSAGSTLISERVVLALIKGSAGATRRRLKKKTLTESDERVRVTCESVEEPSSSEDTGKSIPVPEEDEEQEPEPEQEQEQAHTPRFLRDRYGCVMVGGKC